MNNLSKIAFTKSERRGICILLTLVLSAYIFNLSTQPKLEIPQAEISLNELIQHYTDDHSKRDAITERVRQLQKRPDPKTFNPIQEIKCQTFNPNTIDSIALNQFGLKHYIIKNILNYRSKGGYFSSCSDLSKIYGIDNRSLKSLIDCCKIKSNIKRKTNRQSFRRKPTVNINEANADELKSLYGIGPKLSERIVKYRNSIGGFHSTYQLLDVYGIQDSILIKNGNRIICEGPVGKLNINEIQLKDLAQKTLLNYKQSKAIINYRSHHGPFQNIEGLKAVKALNDSIYQKLYPYIEI